MKKITPRLWAFVFAGFALLALVLLAGSLNSLEMSSGKPFSISQAAPPLYDPNISSAGMRWVMAIFRVVMILMWIALPLYLILLIISKEERKRFLRNMILWLPIFLLLFYLLNRQPTLNGNDTLSQGMTGNPNPGDATANTIPPPTFTPPPEWVTTIATVAIALVITALIVGIFFMLWKQSRNRLQLREPLRRVEKEARVALDAISAGGDLREAVIRCYLQMIEALQEYRGIHRDQDITPHEFEIILAKRGMPGEPVHQLTTLFEEVRYGTFKPGRKEEQVAIASLSAIVSACQRVAERRG